MAGQRNDDDQTDRQRQAARRGEIIPGKGFDAGTGYGGAGNDNAYESEHNYGAGDDAGSAQRDSDESRRQGSAFDAKEGDFDADSPLGGERREPGR